MQLYNKSNASRLTGYLSILCSVFIAVIGWFCILALVFSLDYEPGSIKTLPPIQEICYQAVGLLITGALIGTFISVVSLLVGGFIILWKPNWQIASRIGVYLSIASGIAMIMGFFISIPVRMSINLSAFEASLGAALLSIFPIIYMTFPVILLIKQGRVK